MNQLKQHRNNWGLCFSKFFSLKRISKKRFYFIIFLSIISILILTYQTIDYIRGASCCGGTLPEIVRAFREYGTFLGTPISLYGILQMILTISLLVFISITSLPNYTFFSVDYSQFVRGTYYLLLAVMIISSILVVNLIYIEFIIIQSICLPCTVSQVTIFSNTLLIYFWEPLKTENQ